MDTNKLQDFFKVDIEAIGYSRYTAGRDPDIQDDLEYLEKMFKTKKSKVTLPNMSNKQRGLCKYVFQSSFYEWLSDQKNLRLNSPFEIVYEDYYDLESIFDKNAIIFLVDQFINKSGPQNLFFEFDSAKVKFKSNISPRTKLEIQEFVKTQLGRKLEVYSDPTPNKS